LEKLEFLLTQRFGIGQTFALELFETAVTVTEVAQRNLLLRAGTTPAALGE
jgi:hypothetical protein